MDRVKDLHQNLKTVKTNYKVAQKAARKAYRADKKAIKEQIKAEKRAQRKKAKKPAQAPQKTNGPSFLSKCDTLKDSTILAICEPFEAKAQAIRYKRRDPEGYEADMVIADTEKIVGYFEKRAKKNKPLSDNDRNVLMQLSITTNIVAEQRLGSRYDRADELSDIISDLLFTPEQQEENERVAQQMLDKIDAMFAAPALP